MAYTPINKGQLILEPQARAEEFERRRGAGVEEAYAENRRQWSEYPRRQIVADHPLHVDIELASVCNLRCPMCYTITEGFKKQVNAKLMDMDLFKRLVDQCADGGVYSIRLSLRGEAFLHKHILECIRYAKGKGIQEVSTLTNGLKLDEEMFRQVMEAGLDWISLSVDGMGATYESIRQPAKFDRLVEKLRNFKAIKEQAGRVKPVIKIQSVFPAISDDPQAFYDFFAPLSDQVATNPLIDYLRHDGKDNILYHEDFTCPQLFQRLTIGADGLVMLCANDELNEHVVGDVNTQSIHDVWHGDRMREAREKHIMHQWSDLSPCTHCYLPRRTEPAEISIKGYALMIENYVNRSQNIGE